MKLFQAFKIFQAPKIELAVLHINPIVLKLGLNW